jgi:hypothetical protein
MPPTRNLVPGVRYALTGGVYQGSRAGEYYLQLWLWDMSGSTMIYTDDLVYVDINRALESVPGLVEWLFSHIREVVIEIPVSYPDPFFMLGMRAGLSPRWYISPDEVTPGASALNFEGGVSGALRLNSLVSVQLEIILSGDTVVYRGLDWENGGYTMANEKFTSLSLMFPLLCRLNFKPGPFRVSPFAGLYLIAPLGQTGYRLSTKGGEESYSYSYSIPAGYTAGLEAARNYGPGMFLAGLRYAGDFGDVTINDGPETSYRRHIFSLYLGYEFGFHDVKK